MTTPEEHSEKRKSEIEANTLNLVRSLTQQELYVFAEVLADEWRLMANKDVGGDSMDLGFASMHQRMVGASLKRLA